MNIKNDIQVLISIDNKFKYMFYRRQVSGRHVVDNCELWLLSIKRRY